MRARVAVAQYAFAAFSKRSCRRSAAVAARRWYSKEENLRRSAPEFSQFRISGNLFRCDDFLLLLAELVDAERDNVAGLEEDR